jgi:large subunit ribosomal protein L13
MTKTVSARKEDVAREWLVVSAKGQRLGRLAARVAAVLRGKHKPCFTPHVDCGDFVIVTDVETIELTGNKLVQKMWYRHSGYPGGLKAANYQSVMAKRPQAAFMKAVRGMLPHNKLGRKMLKKLRVYRGAGHPHEAQQPTPLEI